MKKILSILVCVCVLLSAMVMTVSAAGTTAYVKVTEAPADWSGDYLIVYEDGANTRVLNGGLSTIDAEGNYIKVAMTNGVIEANATTNAAKFTVEKYNNGYSLKSASGLYMGNTSNQNKIITNASTKYENTLTLKSDGTVDVVSAGSYLRSNIATTNGDRFRYYKSSSYTNQKAICLYKLVTTADDDGDDTACTHTATSTEANGDETHKVVCDDCGETVNAAVDCADADVNGKCDVCNGDVAIPTPDPTPDSTLTIVEAIALGEKKEHNTYTTGKYYVTGVIESVYNTQYGNMYIVDENGNRLTVYGTYDATGENGYAAMANAPVAGDTVKLYGKIGYYSSSAQMKNAWIIEVTPGEGEESENNDPAADSVLTIEQALALGATKTHNTYTENKYYVTGVITEIYNEMYGNMKITDEAGNILTVYGTYDETGETRFDAMETKPAVGDTVTVYGIIGQYNGTAQMKNGWFKAAPVVDDDNDNDSDNAGGSTGGTTGGDTTGGATTGSTSGSTTGTTTDTNKDNANTDNSTTSPATGDSMGAVAMMAIAAAAVLVASKKR